jgi:hypothetical protein
MKTTACIASIVLVLLSTACSAEQSLSVQLAFGSWLSDDELSFGETGYAYNHGGLTLEGMIHYRTYEHVLTPFIGVVYRFDEMPGGSKDETTGQLNVTNMLIEAGIGKTFEAGHSKMELSIGLGYCMRDLEVEGGMMNLLALEVDGAAFIGGFAVHFPFFERVDATILYQIVYSAGGMEEGNYGWLDYSFDLSDIHHLFSFGLSYYP